MRRITMFAATCCLLALTARADVALTVRDHVGVRRAGEPVSTGVCFAPGQVKEAARLSLVDAAGRAVPAQFLPMVTLEDGSIQWALLDFQADCPANGSADYVVKIGAAPAAPAQPVKVAERDGVYTLTNGPLQVVVDASTPIFELFKSVKADGKEVITGLGRNAMFCRDALDNNKTYHAGRPTKVEFDWQGPMRATLMLEGPYVDDAGAEWLGYRVRVSMFAGSKLLRVEHELRNSCPAEARTVKVKEAAIRFGYEGPAAGGDGGASLLSGQLFVSHRLLSGYFSPGLHELKSADKTLTLGVVPVFEGGFEPRLHRGYNNQDKDKNGNPADYNPGDTGSWWLIDCAYKIDEYWLGFGVAGGADEQANLAKALNSRLYALAPASHYSECQAFGFGHFGTLEDEIATYRTWGWKNIEPKKEALLKGRWMQALPDYYVASDLVHNETETDDAEGCLLMALRTGGRGYLDAGLAWARYYTNNFVPRMDFPADTKRAPEKRKFNFVGRDYEPIIRYGTSYGNGRTCGCHFYGGGAMDYYCLTGDKSILLGCFDLVNYVLQRYGPAPDREPGKTGVSGWGSRAFGRQFLAVIRMYQIMRTEQTKANMDFMARLMLNDPHYIREDDYGFLHASGSNSVEKKHCTTNLAKFPRLKKYMDDKGLTWDEKSSTITAADGRKWDVYNAAGSWEQTYVQQAMHRYWAITGDKDAADYVVRFANFFNRFAWDSHCQQVGYRLWGVHFPEKGMCLGAHLGRWDDAHDTCPGPGAVHSGWYTCFGPDVAVRAYAVSRDAKYLDQARQYWNRGSKWGYRVTKPAAADDEVGSFAAHVPPKDDSILSTALMFYTVPRAKK